MTLTEEQIEELKAQLSEQIAHLPEDKRQEAQEQIDELSAEALESMVKQQKSSSQKQEVFRMIISEEIPSKKIDENKEAIAVLDIRPISKGHSIIIPKDKVNNANNIPTACFSLAKKVSKNIITKLKAKGTEIQTEFKFGEIVINVIPVYEKPVSLNSPRIDSKEEDLEYVYKTLRIIKKPKVIKLNKTKPSLNLIKLKRKIP